MCDELTEWLEEGRDAVLEAIAAFDAGKETEGLDCLVLVLGTPVRHHSEPTP